jgi:L-asparaginase type I
MLPTDSALSTDNLHPSEHGRLARRKRRVRWPKELLKLRQVLVDKVVAAISAPLARTVERHHKTEEPSMTQALSENHSGHASSHDRSIGLVLTGGTIAAREDNSVLTVRDDSALVEEDILVRVWPGSEKPHVVVESPLRQLSENLRPRDWVSIAEAVRRLIEEKHVAGVIVLHGTDTMAYTASALSFLLSDLNRPVVLTGSNLPSGKAGSDASRNVRAALVALRALESGVYIAFAGGEELPGCVYLGTRARKLRASGKAFVSVNRKLVGEVEGDQFKSREPHAPQRHPRRTQKVDEHVLALRLHPGLNLDAMFAAVVHGNIRGVVIELYASATGPDTNDNFSVPKFIRRCAKRKVIVTTAVTATPRFNGSIYETALAITDAGGIFLRDMLPETATVKLMWALAQSDDPKVVEDLMLTPIAGELRETHSH